MKYIDVPPGSWDWHLARLGIPTASCADKIVTASGAPSRSRDKYMHDLIAERLLGVPTDTYGGDFMERGSALETEAVKFYEFTRNIDTTPGGFVTTDDGRAGCSPDRLVGDRGGLEIKCPKPATHVGYMLGHGAVAKDYVIQVQFSLWVSEREWWDTLSYHPDLPEALQRVERDEKLIRLISDRTKEFNDELDELHKRALAMRERAA